MGRADIQESYESAPYGFDSVPVKDLRAIHAETGEKGKTVVIGYINVKQLASLKPGEVRIFSTDKDGNLKIDIRLKDDGTIEMGGTGDFMVRFDELKTGFDKLKSDFNGFLTHVHGAAGTPPVPVVLPSTASIDDAKIDEIKTTNFTP